MLICIFCDLDLQIARFGFADFRFGFADLLIWIYRFPDLDLQITNLDLHVCVCALELLDGNCCCAPVPLDWAPCRNSVARLLIIGEGRCSGEDFTALLARSAQLTSRKACSWERPSSRRNRACVWSIFARRWVAAWIRPSDLASIKPQIWVLNCVSTWDTLQ